MQDMERRTLENIRKLDSLLGGIGSKISSDVQQQTASVAASLSSAPPKVLVLVSPV